MDQHLQQEQHRVCVLQHSLDDKVAELDMARVEQEVSDETGCSNNLVAHAKSESTK